MFANSSTSGRRRSQARGIARLAMALSGVAVAVIAIAPAAHAATMAPKADVSRAAVVPDVTGCQYFTDGETYWTYYCSTGPGEFRTALKCIGLGKSPYWTYGPWEVAGGRYVSTARCQVNDFVDYGISQVTE